MPVPSGPAPFRRGFVEVHGRRLHYVRHGSGPALVLLHASPCSSRVMAPLQKLWGNDFTTFAFDLPGFGLSDPPEGDEVTIADLARLIGAAIDALGIRRPALYGRHTGASVALELACGRPGEVALLLTDGLPIFAKPYDDARLAEYLPPITPSWDGGHLVWTFYRYREQHIFWPWDRPMASNRADADLPDAEFLHRGTIELLESAPEYARIYRSAFIYDSLAGLARLRCPAIFGNRPGDSQFRTLSSYPDPSLTHVLPRDPDLAARAELDLLRRHRGPDHARPHDPGPVSPRGFLPTRHGDVYVRRTAADVAGRPVLVLPDLPGGIDLHIDLLDELSATGPAAGFDPAWNGESRSNGAPDLEVWCDQIEDLAGGLGWTEFDIRAVGTSAAVALAFARRRPARVGRIVLQSPPMLGAQASADLCASIPDIAPTADGAHLLRLWHHQRDLQLWAPGPDRSHRARRLPGPGLSSAELNRRAIVLLKQPWHYRAQWSLLMAQDLEGARQACPVPVEVIHRAGDPFAPTPA